MVKLMGCFFFAFIFLLATPHRALTHAPSSTSIQQLLSPLSDIHRQFFTVHQLGVKTCCKNLSNHKQFRQICFVFFPFGGGGSEKSQTNLQTFTCRTNVRGFTPPLCGSPQETSITSLKGFFSPYGGRNIRHQTMKLFFFTPRNA